MACLPINCYLIKLLKAVFDNDYGLYLDDQVAKNLKEIFEAISPKLTLDLLGVYYSRNTTEVDSLIDKYSFYSYGDAIFTNILFLFTSNGFSDAVQKFLFLS